jgi:hypothetical protein
VTVHCDKFLIIKPTSCTNFSNLLLEWISTCFGRFLCPSSGGFHCTHSKLVWHIPLLCVQWKPPDDGQRNFPKHAEFHSNSKFEKLVQLVGFSIKNLKVYTFNLLLPAICFGHSFDQHLLGNIQVQNGKIASQEASSSQSIYQMFCESTKILVDINLKNKPTNKHTPYGVKTNTDIIIYITFKKSYTLSYWQDGIQFGSTEK